MDWILHHIGYLADDLEADAARWCADFGYVRDGPARDDPAQTARVCFLRLPTPGPWLELVAPLGTGGKLDGARRRQETLHHLCYETANLPAAVAGLRARGWLVVGEPAPAPAFGGRAIAWVMNPRRCLIEILQAGEGPYSLPSPLTNPHSP